MRLTSSLPFALTKTMPLIRFSLRLFRLVPEIHRRTYTLTTRLFFIHSSTADPPSLSRETLHMHLIPPYPRFSPCFQPGRSELLPPAVQPHPSVQRPREEALQLPESESRCHILRTSKPPRSSQLAIRNVKHSTIGVLFSTHCGLQHVVGATRCHRRLKLPASRPSAFSLTNNASFCNTLATQLNAPRPTPDHMESDVHVAHSPRSLVRTIGEGSFHKISHQPRWTLTAILTSRYAAARSTRYVSTCRMPTRTTTTRLANTAERKRRTVLPPISNKPTLCRASSSPPHLQQSTCHRVRVPLRTFCFRSATGEARPITRTRPSR